MARSPKLDRIDLKILAQLQENGRISNVDLANRVGLSSSPCLQRVKRLEQAGYIESYGAQLRLDKLGDLLMVFTEVTLSDHRTSDFARFEAAIRKVEEVVECHLVSGGYDYLLKFMARSIADYQQTIERVLESEIGIEKYFSYVVMKPIFQRHALPLQRFFDSA